MNDAYQKWKPSMDDIIGIFIGILFMVAVYVYMGTTFAGRSTTTILLLISWIILNAYGLIYEENRHAVISLLSLGFGIIGFVTFVIYGGAAIITLSAYAIVLALVLTNKALYYLARDQK